MSASSAARRHPVPVPAEKPNAKPPVRPDLKALARSRSGEDREFLPAALEILETPASPARVVFLWLICAMFAAALGWSWFAKLDIYAVAPGRIQVSGRSKIVQPVEPGTVHAVRVRNGDHVQAGDTLIEIEDAEVEAEVETQTNELENLGAEIIRRRAAIVSAQSPTSQPHPRAFAPSAGSGVEARAEAGFVADLDQLASNRDSLKAQIAQNDAQRQRLAMSVAARQRLTGSLKERVDMREQLVASNAGTRASVLDAMQQLQSEDANLAYDKGQLIETDAAAAVLQSKIVQVDADFIVAQTDKLEDAERKQSRVKDDLIKASARARHFRLTAPMNGTVQQLAVTTPGQVVTTGQPLMVIVPSEGSLEIEAMIMNRDIGFVSSGQSAVVKVDAFPFTRYGAIDGTVSLISKDAVDERDAEGGSDTLRLSQSQGLSQAGPGKTQNLVFPVTVSLAKQTIDVDGKTVPLSPGMTANIEVRTGEQRVLAYLFSPLHEMAAMAGHER